MATASAAAIANSLFLPFTKLSKVNLSEKAEELFEEEIFFNFPFFEPFSEDFEKKEVWPPKFLIASR